MERASADSPRRLATVAVAIAAAYYAGAHLGFILRLPPATPSILWPPNAILTAALLLTPPRRWWIWILAVFPAHVVVELEAAFPAPLILALFVTNCSEALMGAAGVRAFSDAPHRFDTLRRMLVFVVMSALTAPFLSTFLDASAVTLIRGEDYWEVWRTRFFSNVLGQLALVPAIVSVAGGGRRWLRKAPPRAKLEGAAFGLGVIVLAMAVFGLSATPTPLAFLLPLLMVAAVRFGPAGAGLAFLAVTLAAIWTGTYRKGPFADLPQAEGVLALQVYLSVVAIPIYAVASLIEERRQAQQALAERLQFQKTLSRLTAAFVHVPVQEIESTIQDWLRPVGMSLHLEQLELREPNGAVCRAWAKPAGNPPSPQPLFTSVAPLVAGDHTLGALAGTARLDGRSSREELEEQLQLVAEVFANALARQGAERAVRAAELEAQRSRAELAHYNRVSTMGELTASLAHELRQPLSGILTNAQAALRFLAADRPDLEELRLTMADIVEDDRRAAAVLQRLRDLLTKREPTRARLDLNAVVRGVAALLSSDAVIRRVQVSVQLTPAPLTVLGDRIQLEQVVLNLMLNAMEAMADCAERERVLVVATEREESVARMAVMDAGCGLPEGDVERVFEPFYTTKPTGMGMGLPIARSIVQSHGGTIQVRSNGARGTTFELQLPLHPR